MDRFFNKKGDSGMMRIHLHHLQVESKKSCEKQSSLSQKISLSLNVSGNFFACAQDDNIAHTLDYDLLAQKITHAVVTVPCEHDALLKKVHESLDEIFPNYLSLQGSLRLLCCRSQEKPHCFSFVNSLDKHL